MRFDGVQVLRGLAALLVLAVHSHILVPKNTGGGALGVDLFFVISGFVVAMAAGRARTPRAFLANRATRVLPLYFATSIGSLLWATEPSLNQWVNTFVMLPLVDVGTYTTPLHWFGWSIALEMWFYLLLAAALLLVPGRALSTFCLTVGVIVLLGCFYRGDVVVLRFMACPMALEFVLGVLLWRCHRRIGPRLAVFLLVAGVVLLCWRGYAAPYLDEPENLIVDSRFALDRVTQWGLPGFLAVAGVVGLDLRGVRWPRPCVRLGDMSYSFYLVQPFSIALAQVFEYSSWWAAAPALLAINVCVASLTYRYFERPVTEWLRRPPALLASEPMTGPAPL